MAELSTQKPLITEVFVEGAKRGWDLATKSMLPNLVMAFVLIKVENYFEGDLKFENGLFEYAGHSTFSGNRPKTCGHDDFSEKPLFFAKNREEKFDRKKVKLF